MKMPFSHCRVLSFNPVIFVAFLAGILALSSSVARAEKPIWPLQSNIDLSSGYGDYRPGRFHYGLDLRTHGVKRVVAPVSGYIQQVWVQYFGYGKSLYLQGDDGRVYVFAHLDRFADKLNNRVQELQFSKKRYFVREWFKPAEFRVKQGELIAYSGQTGIGAPHLHFETRDSENIPRSPLKCGLNVTDNRSPIFKSLTFEYLDKASLFGNGRRKQSISAKRLNATNYTLTAVPYMSAPFGTLARVLDYTTNTSFEMSPYTVELSLTSRLNSSPEVDDTAIERTTRTVYAITLDSISYSEATLSQCIFDQSEALNDLKNVYRLFSEDATLSCYNGRDWSNGGVFPDSAIAGVPPALGVYQGRVIATDETGNKSTLDFQFAYGPSGNLFRVIDYGPRFVMVEAIRPDLLSGPLELSKLEVAEFTRDGSLNHLDRAVVTPLMNGAYKIDLSGLKKVNSERILRLVVLGRDGWVKPDVLLTHFARGMSTDYTIDFSAGDHGLYVDIKSSKQATELPILGSITMTGERMNWPVTQIGANKFSAFIPADTLHAPIMKLDVFNESREQTASGSAENIFAGALAGELGLTYRRFHSKNGIFSAPLCGNDLPHLLTVRLADEVNAMRSSIVAGPFELAPQDFRFDYSVRIAIEPPSKLSNPEKVAIAMLSGSGSKWAWFDTKYDSATNIFSAEINSPGIFALLRDASPPSVSPINFSDGATLKPGLQKLRFQVGDELSGIWSDTLFDCRIDDDWMIPEFDAEDNILELTARAPFRPGKRTLSISVTDNAGNITRRSYSLTAQ